MRAVECWCGHMLHAEDDEELARELREHVDAAHPDERRSDEEVRARVQEHAYEPPSGEAPWAY